MPALIQTEDAAAIPVSETVEEGLNVRIGRCEDGSFHFKGLAHNP
jgi:hypothetical protein